MDTRVQPGNVVLVHVEEKPAFFARVEEIDFDVKKGWRRIRFLVLTAPPQELTWILEPVQIDGEPFTMGGTSVRIERLPDPKPSEPEEPPATEAAPKPAGKVISFPARKGG
jgi:hypothetical protein